MATRFGDHGRPSERPSTDTDTDRAESSRVETVSAPATGGPRVLPIALNDVAT